MTPIQTRIWDSLQKQWLEGDSVTNLFTHPETGLTEGLTEFLAEPYRYKITRWTGELDSADNKIFVGDYLEGPPETGYIGEVLETGSSIVLDGYGHLYDIVLTEPWFRTGDNVLEEQD